MDRFQIDDPMLALIARFTGCCSDPAGSQEVFLRRQLDAVRADVERYPEQERQERALEWIARNAEDYRRRWQERLVSEAAADTRCPDCPLARLDRDDVCEIHRRWVELLERYLSGASSSRTYVEETLRLLQGHKERLWRHVWDL